jgi:hypothetical protein
MQSCFQPDLEVFIFDKQEQPGVISFDIQSGLLSETETLDEDAREALKSLKKINVLLFPVKKAQDDIRNRKDIEQLDNILKKDKYQPLMSFGSGKSKAKMYLVGDEDQVDEIIIYARDKDKGWGLFRLLGKDMNPAAMMKVLKHLNPESLLSGMDEKNIKDILQHISN